MSTSNKTVDYSSDDDKATKKAAPKKIAKKVVEEQSANPNADIIKNIPDFNDAAPVVEEKKTADQQVTNPRKLDIEPKLPNPIINESFADIAKWIIAKAKEEENNGACDIGYTLLRYAKCVPERRQPNNRSKSGRNSKSGGRYPPQQQSGDYRPQRKNVGPEGTRFTGPNIDNYQVGNKGSMY